MDQYSAATNSNMASGRCAGDWRLDCARTRWRRPVPAKQWLHLSAQFAHNRLRGHCLYLRDRGRYSGSWTLAVDLSAETESKWCASHADCAAVRRQWTRQHRPRRLSALIFEPKEQRKRPISRQDPLIYAGVQARQCLFWHYSQRIER